MKHVTNQGEYQITEYADTLIRHAHLFTMQGEGVGYIADGAVATTGNHITAVGPTLT